MLLLSISLMLFLQGGPAARPLDRRIPAPDFPRYSESWKKVWLNPRIVVDTESLSIVTPGDSIRISGPDEVSEKLLQLPRKAWPHGRIVALSYTRRFALAKGDQGDVVAQVKDALAGLEVEVIETPVGCDCE